MSSILDSVEIHGVTYDIADSNSRAESISMMNEINDIRAHLGIPEMDIEDENALGILGIRVDYENKTFKRLANAVGLNAGSDFDKFKMYGERKRCNVSDDGTITAWWGEENYKEDGSNGQVMVYQPKFYYKVVPIKKDIIEGGLGYHLRCCNYYISQEKLPGFKTHPAFFDVHENEIDYILESAFDGSIYDESAKAYLTRDEQIADFEVDKLSSIANVKPASGLSQDLSLTNSELLSKNRGEGWHVSHIKIESADQLLMLIEYGTMELQSVIGEGVVRFTDDGASNLSSLTGSTSALGNKTGMASETINEVNGTETTYTENGKVAISYRGKENPWGNIYKHVQGLNIYGEGNNLGGIPYICKGLEFGVDVKEVDYESAGFTIANNLGYISSMGWSEDCDWLFLPTETDGDSALPVGDRFDPIVDLNGYGILTMYRFCNSGNIAGLFSGKVTASDYSSRVLNPRLVYIPQSKKVLAVDKIENMYVRVFETYKVKEVES